MGKLRIDQDACIGCSACTTIAPDVFVMNDETLKAEVKLDIQGLEKFKNYINGSDGDVDTAIGVCPARAIKND